jgi:hypothetical protein
MSTSTKDVLRSFRGTIADFRMVDESNLLVQYDSFFCGTPRFIEYAELMGDFLDSEDLAGIAGIQELDLEKGFVSYTMESTHALTELLARSQRPFSTRAAIELILKSTEILIMAGYAAQISGIENHGNLSFDTIWLNEAGNVQIINYGMQQFDLLAYQNGEIEEPNVASCLFTPPERLGFDQESPSSDIFSLGLLLFTLLTRQYLYQGNTEEIIKQAKSGMPHKNILHYQLPEIIVPLLQKMLHPNLYERYADLDELQSALHDIEPSGLLGASLEEELHAFFSEEERVPILTVHNEEEELRRIAQAEQRLQEEENQLKKREEEKKATAQQKRERARTQELEEEEIAERERLQKLEEEEQLIKEELERKQQEERQSTPPLKKSEEKAIEKTDQQWQEEATLLSHQLHQKSAFFSQDLKRDRAFMLALTTIEVDLLQFPDENGSKWFTRLTALSQKLEEEIQTALRREGERKQKEEEE